MKRIETVLAPIDHSELANDVFDMALTMGDAFGARVVLLRIQSDPASLQRGEADVDLRVIEQEIGELRVDAAGRIAKAGLQNLDMKDVGAEVRAGPLVTTIVEAAAEHRADLIIMGTHGRSGLSELFTGSTTEQVVAKTPVSVMVLKPEGFPYLRD